MKRTATRHQRIDWQAERDRVALPALVTRLLGPAPGRRGGGRRLWWHCPFHQDANPSFEVDPQRPHSWRCRGCGEHGDAINLVRRLYPQMSFPEAAHFILGEALPPQATPLHKAPSPRAAPARRTGIPEAEAMALMEAAERRLWTDEGASHRACLMVERGLTEATIRAARLGSTPPLDVPGKPMGITVPWLNSGRLSLLKVRQPPARSPKYCELFRRLPRVYLGNGPILAGVPLVIVEGEFDALLLGQELGTLARVVTLGSASARPDRLTFAMMQTAHPWYIATDNDPAGDQAAGRWPPGARRVRPPLGKDWTEARQGGVNLRRWWGDILLGLDPPPPFTWDELAAMRWGPAAGDLEPGFVVDRGRIQDDPPRRLPDHRHPG